LPGGRDPVRRVRRTPKDSSMLYQAHCELNGGRYDRNVVSLKADFTVGSSLITQSITLWQASSCRQCHCCTIRNHCHNTITGASIIGGLAYRSACDEGYINYPDVRHANQAAPVSFFATEAARAVAVPGARCSGGRGVQPNAVLSASWFATVAGFAGSSPPWVAHAAETQSSTDARRRA